jgi:hypothetical protein
MITFTNTSLDDFLKKEGKRVAWVNSNKVTRLIKDGDLQVISMIEATCLSWSGKYVAELNSKLSISSKKKLKRLLVIYNPSLLKTMISMSFSFDQKSLGN